jgi:hypothetical protein
LFISGTNWDYKVGKTMLILSTLYRCMGHNKGWEEAASMFSGASIELNTCNAALLEAAGKSWAEVRLAPFLFVPGIHQFSDLLILCVKAMQNWKAF